MQNILPAKATGSCNNFVKTKTIFQSLCLVYGDSQMGALIYKTSAPCENQSRGLRPRTRRCEMLTPSTTPRRWKNIRACARHLPGTSTRARDYRGGAGVGGGGRGGRRSIPTVKRQLLCTLYMSVLFEMVVILVHSPIVVYVCLHMRVTQRWFKML